MKKRFFLPLIALVLSGCKTNELYARNLYNSPIFDENYYTIYDNIGDENNLTSAYDNTVAVSLMPELDGTNLGAKYDSFNHGILSKLYDARTECGQLYQLSRVQVDKSGFGTKLPQTLTDVGMFEFAARGGSTCSAPLNTVLQFNIEVEFVDLSLQKTYTYHINNVDLPTDKGGETYIYKFELHDSINVSYYSFKFNCASLPEGVTDDYTVEGKEHLSIMLYEVTMYPFNE